MGLAGRTAARAELILVALKKSARVSIGRGENGGRTVTYTNVVRDERKLAVWNGGILSIPVDAGMLETAGADRHAVVLRRAGGGPVVAARMLR